MTESQFLRAIEATLADVEAAFEDSGIDADCALAGLVLTVELDDGGKIVINAQAPMRQLWLASRNGAMHFAYDGAQWRDVRSGVEFFEALSLAVSALMGRDVRLAAR
jgi:CyaY protein